MKRTWGLAAVLGGVAAVLYLVSLAGYVFPGESASLMASWKGVSPSVGGEQYPLMALFARLFGASNLISLVCGVISVVTLFHLAAACVAAAMNEEDERTTLRDTVSKIAGAVTAVVFMLSPAVRCAATHLEPKMFDFTWAMLAFALAFPWLRFKIPMALYDLALGAMVALGMFDSALFAALLPVYLIVVARVAKRREANWVVHPILFLVFLLLFLCVSMVVFHVGFAEFLRKVTSGLGHYRALPGWVLVLLFSTIPFVADLLAAPRSLFDEEQTAVRRFFHVAMAIASVIAVATPMSASRLMEPYGYLPVAASAFAAFAAGYVVAYWWLRRKTAMGLVVGGVLVFVLGVSCVWNLFTFDGDKGAFADKVARKIIDDLGGRHWIISDGVLDNHLRLIAARDGLELNVISLSRDSDKKYIEFLRGVVDDKNLGGSKNAELKLSLTLGVLPFVQDWLAADPDAANEVVVFGAPDIWMGAGRKPVPEFAFFGADEKRVPDWSRWKEFSEILSAPRGWGSYRDRKQSSPLDRMRLGLRRHFGLVANNRGVYLQDQGKDDEAWKMYELVLNDIDHDNICALFNEVEMMDRKHTPAVAKRRDLERMVKAALDDAGRRYILWQLSTYYGYVRNPDAFIRLGYAWAKSGRPGDAIGQVRRAMDYVAGDRKASLLNLMASLYVTENEQAKSRRIYEAVLAKNNADHDALMGMMRLELLEGNSEKAAEYMQRAADSSGNAKRAKVELAMVAMMKNDLGEAKRMLKAAVDADRKDMQAWSLLSAVTIQQVDATKDAAAKKALEDELEKTILPAMEQAATNKDDYYLLSTRGFLMMRKGEEKRKEAREAFVKAARARPDIAAAHDMVLGMDMSLNDREGAEAHAREVLRRNRRAPLANYVMGSLALSKGNEAEAEAFLRRAVDVPQPVVLALNDLAELLRRQRRYDEAEECARKAVKLAPKLYVAWETLGSVLMDAGKSLDEAEASVKRACELSKEENGTDSDVRMLMSLARVQILRGDKEHAKISIRKVQSRVSELNDFERSEFEKIRSNLK